MTSSRARRASSCVGDPGETGLLTVLDLDVGTGGGCIEVLIDFRSELLL